MCLQTRGGHRSHYRWSWATMWFLELSSAPLEKQPVLWPSGHSPALVCLFHCYSVMTRVLLSAQATMSGLKLKSDFRFQLPNSCLCLSSAGVTGMHHHTCQGAESYTDKFWYKKRAPLLTLYLFFIFPSFPCAEDQTQKLFLKITLNWSSSSWLS